MTSTTATRPLLMGPTIVTRYLGPTDHKGSRVVATHKRDSDKTYRVTLSWCHRLDGPQNHREAAEALLRRFWPDSDLVICGRGHDHDAYFWLCCGAWQLQQEVA